MRKARVGDEVVATASPGGRPVSESFSFSFCAGMAALAGHPRCLLVLLGCMEKQSPQPEVAPLGLG